MKRRYGHRWGKPDPRDRLMSSLVGARRAAVVRPTSLTYEHLAVVLDQGASSSCEAHAWCQSLHLRAAILDTPIPLLSRAAVYSLALERDQGTGALADVGTYARTVGQVLTTDGVCAEERWPFDRLFTPSGTIARPPWGVLQMGGDARGSVFAALEGSGSDLCDEIRDALAKGYPVTFGMQVDQAFEDGRFAVYSGLSGAPLGGHALCIVGYRPGAFRVINSWGTEWNDGGFFWLADAAVQSAAFGDPFAIDVAPQVAA